MTNYVCKYAIQTIEDNRKLKRRFLQSLRTLQLRIRNHINNGNNVPVWDEQFYAKGTNYKKRKFLINLSSSLYIGSAI